MLKNNVLPNLILITTVLTFVGCAHNNSNNSVNLVTAKTEVSKSQTLSKFDPNAIENSPIDQVFKQVKDLHDFRILSIHQVFDSPEAGKNEATVILTKDGLADDSIGAKRVKYDFKLVEGQWREIAKEQSWRCNRGADITSFHQKLCP